MTGEATELSMMTGPGAPRPPGSASARQVSIEDSELVALVRSQLRLDDACESETIVASLAAIAAADTREARWRAAFDSGLGRHLAARGSDLSTAIGALVAIVLQHGV
jgi:hypothetical protein